MCIIAYVHTHLYTYVLMHCKTLGKILSLQKPILFRVFLLSNPRQGGSYEGRRGHGKGFKRNPIEIGEELEVDITEFSPKEEGVAKIQGLVIYVPNTKPGNHVKIRILQSDGKAAKAEIIN
jgi:predicted RNA-binding protein with TRAM domain